MRYFVIFISILLGAAVIWAVFFSGMLINKTKTETPATKHDESVDARQIVVLVTDFGEIRVKPDFVAAPETAANFVKLANEGFYNGLTFHRVIPRFVVQGGDPKGDGTGGPGYTLPAEIRLPHKRGAIAMARLGDAQNPERRSSGSQFYIALSDLPDLDGQYTVFGQVRAGMEVVDRIAQVKTDAFDKPLEKITIKKVLVTIEQ